MFRQVRVWIALLLFFSVLYACVGALCQNLGSSSRAGVVVESAAGGFEAEKAGLHEGDIILHWSRSDNAGEISSPFDLSSVEVEQAPRGAVTLIGLRETQTHTWTLGPAYWRLKSRPGSPDFPLSNYKQGTELAEAGKFMQAAAVWQAAALRSEQAGALLNATWLYFHSADTLAKAHEWDKMNRAYAQAIESAAGDSTIGAQVLESWADASKERGDWNAARKNYERALLESRKSTAETLTVAAILSDLAKLVLDQGDLARAEDYARQAMMIREKLAPASLTLAESFNDLAHVAAIAGNLKMAEGYLTQELATARRVLPESLAVAKALDSLGYVAWQRGDLDHAQDYALEALAIRERLAPVSTNIAKTLTNLGNIAHERGNLTQAEVYHRRALALIEKLSPGSSDVAMYLNNLGDVAADRGDLIRAQNYHSRSLAISQRIAPGSLDVANSFQNLGVIATQRGDWTKAEAYLRQGLAIRNRLAPTAVETALNLRDLGFLFEKTRKLLSAEVYYHRALAIWEKQGLTSLSVAESENDLGRIAFARGDTTIAGDYFRQALAIREKLAPGSLSHAESLAALASVMRRTGKFDIAETLFQQALDALDHQIAHLGGGEDTRAGYRAQHANYYSEYIDLLLERKQPELAFDALECSRARILLEMLAEAQVDIHTGVDPALLGQERSLRESLQSKTDRRIRLLSGQHTEAQLTSINQEISKLAGEYQEIEDEIRIKSPQYAALTQPRSLKTAEVQRLLDPETTLLEYALGEQHSYVWVVTAKNLTWRELAGRAQIESAARRIYKLLSARSKNVKNETAAERRAQLAKAEAEYPKTAAELSRMVLAPVVSELQTKRLLIVSDGALQYVPFAALPIPERAATTKKNDSRQALPLVMDHEIVNLPSASALALLRQRMLDRQTNPKAVAVLADPVFDRHDPRVKGRNRSLNLALHSNEVAPSADSMSEDLLTRSVSDVGLFVNGELRLPRLPFTRQEASAIMAVTAPGQGLDALDFNASRTRALSPELSQYRVVHFATHGLLDSEHPELSGLVLSLVNEKGEPQNGFLNLQDIYNLNLPVDLIVLSACETGLGKEIKGEGLLGLTRGFMYAGASRVVASLWKVDDVATANLMELFYKAMERDGVAPAAALRQAQIEMLKQKRWSLPYYWAAFQIHGEWK